jgi:hypothetical protein
VDARAWTGRLVALACTHDSEPMAFLCIRAL